MPSVITDLFNPVSNNFYYFGMTGYGSFAIWGKFILGIDNDQCFHKLSIYILVRKGTKEVNSLDAGNLILADFDFYTKTSSIFLFRMGRSVMTI